MLSKFDQGLLFIAGLWLIGLSACGSIELRLLARIPFTISTDTTMSDRRLMFYFLLDLLPILVVAGVILVVALSFVLRLCIRRLSPECKPPCLCRWDCECCEIPLSACPIMDTIKDLLAWAIEYLFTYVWSEREKYGPEEEKKNVNKESKAEHNDECQNKESEVKEKESKICEKI